MLLTIFIFSRNPLITEDHVINKVPQNTGFDDSNHIFFMCFMKSMYYLTFLSNKQEIDIFMQNHLTRCHISLKEETSPCAIGTSQLTLKYNNFLNFLSSECIPKCCMQNANGFVLASMCCSKHSLTSRSCKIHTDHICNISMPYTSNCFPVLHIWYVVLDNRMS